ncbi:MAG: hypothetical protein ACTHU0_01930 [Kofleriaceae bacterium]
MTKQLTWFASVLASSLALGACGDDGLTGDDGPPIDAGPDAPPGSMLVDVPAGDLSGDIVWESKNVYTLKGYVFVTGGTLTIEAGTVIKGDNGSALTITKNAKLNAVGTAEKPIVFTSSKANAEPGDWGGVVMLGKASINVAGGTNAIEGFPTTFGDRIQYGGTDNAHDCGKLKYARIEYAGFLLAPGNELNGLTLGGCGSATEIDYVQSHLGQDDGIEVFGGTVNLKHLVITQPDDDGLDWDLGWTGRAQYVIIQQKAGRGDKGIEADNHPNSFDATPRSAPEIWNATIIGGDGPIADHKQGGMHLRRGTAGKINNTIVAYFNQFGIDIDGAQSVAQFGTGLTIKNTYFVKSTGSTSVWPAGFDVSGTPPVENDGGFDELVRIGQDATNRMDIDVKLADPKNLTAPNWKPQAGSPVLTCPPPPAPFDTTATFCGAIGATDWTAGWTKFPE